MGVACCSLTLDQLFSTTILMISIRVTLLRATFSTASSIAQAFPIKSFKAFEDRNNTKIKDQSCQVSFTRLALQIVALNFSTSNSLTSKFVSRFGLFATTLEILFLWAFVNCFVQGLHISFRLRCSPL